MVAGLSLLSPAFAHALDPLWPLCPFETAVKGACHAAGCAYQMRADYALPPAAVLQDVYNLADRCSCTLRQEAAFWSKAAMCLTVAPVVC